MHLIKTRNINSKSIQTQIIALIVGQLFQFIRLEYSISRPMRVLEGENEINSCNRDVADYDKV
jgi:hypothetical protein